MRLTPLSSENMQAMRERFEPLAPKQSPPEPDVIALALRRVEVFFG